MKIAQKKMLKTAGQIAVALALIGVYLFLSQAEETPTHIKGTEVGKPAHLDQFELVDHHENAMSLDKFRGQWLVLFFGYTHCPDVCPTTLAYLTREYAELRELRKYVQVVMVSVDPNRDKPADLKAYVQGFNPKFLAATGTQEHLTAMVKNFGGYYHYHDTESAIEYTVEHPGDIFVISPEGQWHALYRPPLKNGVLSEDLRTLILKHNT